MKYDTFFKLTVTLLVAVFAAFAVAATAEEAEGDAKALFLDNGCNTCHAVSAAEIEAKTSSEKMLGPDLAGYETDDLEALEQYLRKEVERDGTSHKKSYKGTSEQLTNVMAWLGELSAADSADEASQDG